MLTRKVTLGGTLPFTALRAARLARAATSFSARLVLQDARGTFIAKSTLGRLSLGSLSGRVMTLLAEGPDEQAAMDTLALLLEAQEEETPGLS